MMKMSNQDEPKTNQRQQLTKMISGMDEFLQLENQLNSTPQLAGNIEETNEQKLAKITSLGRLPKESPDVQRKQLFVKHHYPVTPLLFGKGSPESFNQIRSDLTGVATKTSVPSKLTTGRQTESKLAKKPESGQKEMASNRPGSSQKKNIPKTPKATKTNKFEQTSAMSSSKKDSMLRNNSALSMNNDTSTFRPGSVSKTDVQNASRDPFSGQKNGKDQGTAEKRARRTGSKNKLNVSTGINKGNELDAASKNKMIAKLRTYYQTQITQVVCNYPELKMKELRETVKSLLDKQLSKLQTASFQEEKVPLVWINFIDFDIKSILQGVQSHVNIQMLDLPTESLDPDRDLAEVIKRVKDASKNSNLSLLTSMVSSPLKRPRSSNHLDTLKSRGATKPNIIDSMLTKHRDLKNKLNSTSKSMEEVEEETSPGKSDRQRDLPDDESKCNRFNSAVKKSATQAKIELSSIEEKKASLVNKMFKSKPTSQQHLSPLFNP